MSHNISYEIWKSGSDGDEGSWGYVIEETDTYKKALTIIKKAIRNGYETEEFSLTRRSTEDYYNPKDLIRYKKGKKKIHRCCH